MFPCTVRLGPSAHARVHATLPQYFWDTRYSNQVIGEYSVQIQFTFFNKLGTVGEFWLDEDKISIPVRKEVPLTKPFLPGRSLWKTEWLMMA